MAEQNTSALRKIQLELKAPKSKFNTFGNFHYRSCEDILEAVKPLLEKYGCEMLITDEVHDVAGIAVITAKVMFKDNQGNLTEAKAHAGVEAKKGMDISQTFGASSTYARKYALNGLFLIDDSHDADSNEYRQNAEAQSSQQNNQQRNNNAQQNRGQQMRDVTPATQQQAASTKPKRPIEERYQAALSQIQFTNDPKLLDTALGAFAPTKYAREIENACRARADQMGWTKGNINQQRSLRQ